MGCLPTIVARDGALRRRFVGAVPGLEVGDLGAADRLLQVVVADVTHGDRCGCDRNIAAIRAVLRDR